MTKPKSAFDTLHPCEFYTPEELLEPDLMYSISEIARLLQELDPDAELDVETENVLLDWTIPWVMYHSEKLVVAEPPAEGEPGYYGRKE